MSYAAVEDFRHPPSLSSPQDPAEDQGGRREPRLSPSQSDTFLLQQPPPHTRTLPFLTQAPLPVLMMSLTAVNTVSMETPTTALAYISGSSPSLHSVTPPPPLACHPASVTLAWCEGGGWNIRGGDGGGGVGEVGGSGRKLTAADRKRKRIFTGQKQGWQSGRCALVVCGTGCPLSSGLVVRSSCSVWRLRERHAYKMYQFETVSQCISIAFLYLAYMNICIYSCCAVGQRTAAADLLSKSSCLHVFNYYNYLNL